MAQLQILIRRMLAFLHEVHTMHSSIIASRELIIYLFVIHMDVYIKYICIHMKALRTYIYTWINICSIKPKMEKGYTQGYMKLDLLHIVRTVHSNTTPLIIQSKPELISKQMNDI